MVFDRLISITKLEKIFAHKFSWDKNTDKYICYMVDIQVKDFFRGVKKSG